jgi:hypothetical protein
MPWPTNKQSSNNLFSCSTGMQELNLNIFAVMMADLSLVEDMMRLLYEK